MESNKAGPKSSEVCAGDKLGTWPAERASECLFLEDRNKFNLK